MTQEKIEATLKNKLPMIEAMFSGGNLPISVTQVSPGMIKVTTGDTPIELTKSQMESVKVLLNLSTVLNPDDFEKEEAGTT